MKWKLLLTALLALLTTCISASAKGFNFGEYTTNAKKGCVAVYDENNNLAQTIATSLANTDYGLVTEDLKLTVGTYNNLKLYIPEDNIVLGEGKPAEINVDEYFKEYPDIYEKDVYAYTAPAMIKKIKTDYVNDEIVYRATILLWGDEKKIIFDENCRIKSSSEAYADAEGEDAGYLQPGDAITINYPFKDKQNDITLIYRPQKSDPLKNTDTTKGFYPLYTKNLQTGGKWPMASDRSIGYYFGIVETVENRYLTLLTGNGSKKYSKDISFTDDTSTYCFDVSDSKSASISTPSSLIPSILLDEEFDENGDIVISNETEPKCYALVRTLDSLAVDIIYYDGFR